jgi:transcription antitermination factor NusG
VTDANPQGFRVGDQVVVTDGTFIGMTGTVLVPRRFYPNLLVVELSIFGKPTPVELDTWHVKHAAARSP